MTIRNALVIGGTGGVGSEVCKTLVEKGFNLSLTWFSHHQKAKELATELNAKAYQFDLNNLENIHGVMNSIVADLNSIDAFVVASGIATGHEKDGEAIIPKFLEVTADGYDTMMSTNVRGVFFACQHVARVMAAQQSGRIAIVSSIDGIKSVPAPVDYACCKAALWGLSQSLAKELGQYNILVNMVAPGILEGGIADLLSDELMNEYTKHSTLKRVGTFREIANVIAYLVSEKNTYLTGQPIILDGGL